jgi:hypothetical protein
MRAGEHPCPSRPPGPQSSRAPRATRAPRAPSPRNISMITDTLGPYTCICVRDHGSSASQEGLQARSVPVQPRWRSTRPISRAAWHGLVVGGRAGGFLAVVTAAFVSVSGCARSGSGEQPPVPNWNNPIHGRVETSLTAAQLNMPFRLRSLRGSARLWRILDTPGLPSDERIIVLQYRTSAGLVDVYEETPQVSARAFRKVITSWVGLNGRPGTSGTASAVMVRGKYPGLMTTAADRSRSDIRWIQAGVEYTVRGPSLTKRGCIRLANELAA